MSLPAGVRAAVTAELARTAGGAAAIEHVAAVGGGCISPAARITLADGTRCFLKWSGRDTPRELFRAEAFSLRALAAAGAVRVPRVVGAAPDWLLLEWLEPGRATAAGWQTLGRELAALHRTRAASYGWPAPNFIGPLPQRNDESAAWPAFWRDRRLAPQLARALRGGHFDARARARFERLSARLDELLAPAAAEGASLLHGDLWNGNVHMLAGGAPALVDPSSYHGHREVDLAMAELFGGFDAAFFRAYDEAWPLLPGAATRKRIYQLYYLLVHVNLFGAGYEARTRRLLRELTD